MKVKCKGWQCFFSAVCVFAFSLLLGMACTGTTSSASSEYQIKVNKQQNCVTIYKKNANGNYKAIKAMVCSTGSATQLGTYSLGEKYRWHTLDGPCYGQYCSRIYGGVLFHSVWYTGYNDPSTLSVSSYNKLGTTASHGCVRLTVADAKWIYNNIPSGTQVVIYSSGDSGPLGKPSAIKVPYSCTWDPTDTDNPNNPWNSKKPTISGVKDRTVKFNDTYDVLDGVKATNTTGFDAIDLVTVKIKYRGETVSEVDTTKPGTYRVKYILVDEIGRKATAKAKIKVTAAKKTPVITGDTKLYVTAKSKLTKNKLLKAVTVTQGGKTLASKYVTVKKKKLKKNVYRITYAAQNASLPATFKLKAYVDKKAPVIHGLQDQASYTVDASEKINASYARSLITKVSDNMSSVKRSDVAIRIKKLSNGAKYKVVYKLRDQAGNLRKVTIYLVSVQITAVALYGSESLTVDTDTLGCGSEAASEEIAEALKAYLASGDAGITAVTSDGTDLTESLSVEITDLGDDSYTAVLTATAADGTTGQMTIQIAVNRVAEAEDSSVKTEESLAEAKASPAETE